MRVLIACETSGALREEFRRLGHDAWSADLLPADDSSPHHILCTHADHIFEIIARGWDLVIMHPECTYLSSSGLHWNKRRPERAKKTEDALRFFERMLRCPGADRRVLENPIGCASTRKSHALIEMVIRGDIERPERFIVLNADPGMEDERTYPIVEHSRKRCQEAGIPFITAPGPNLYQGLIDLKTSGAKRFDHPPYWVKKPDGKRGQLKQKCTRQFKIDPIRRALRQYLSDNFGVSTKRKRGLPLVETWIGFAFDEEDRIKGKKGEKLKKQLGPKYIRLTYPLVERKLTKAKVVGYYMQHGIARPPRSVCAACFGHGLAYLEDMYDNRPNDWDKAVQVDEAIRDLTAIGVQYPAYVSDTLIPLRELAERNFLAGTKEGKEHRCNSGHCFV